MLHMNENRIPQELKEEIDVYLRKNKTRFSWLKKHEKWFNDNNILVEPLDRVGRLATRNGQVSYLTFLEYFNHRDRMGNIVPTGIQFYIYSNIRKYVWDGV